MTVLRTSALAGATLCILATATPAAAQTTELPTLTVGAGAGVVNPLHGDLNFTAPLWEVAVRARVGRRVALEGAFSEWRRNETLELRNVPITTPGGVVGQIGLFEEQFTRRGRSYELNLLALGRIGRVTASAGGGVRSLAMRRRTRQTLTDCVASVPDVCNDSNTESSSATLSFQGLAGVDVEVAPRVAAYGQFRFVMPTQDLGSSEARFTVGARVALY